VWEVDETPEVLIYGHAADVKGLAMNPQTHTTFATACDSGRVCLWDMRTRHMARTVPLGGTHTIGACSLAFSPDSAHLAVGMANGNVNIVDGATLQFFKRLVTSEASIPVADLKYAPNGKVLAAASHLSIDLFDVTSNYTKLGRCSGHTATVSHLDWSVDSKVLFSNCNSYEMLYWDRSCRQV
jgi:WD40 repeat protein